MMKGPLFSFYGAKWRAAAGADWLPFRPLATVKATPRKGARYSAEVVWP